MRTKVMHSKSAASRMIPMAILLALLIAGLTLAQHAARAALPDPPPCTINGTSGSDVLEGSATLDVICGLGGNDTLKGLGGDDILTGGPGADRLFGGQGADDFEGGDGMDAAHFDDSTLGIDASLVSGTATGEGSDLLTSIENLTGSQKDDTLTGSDSENVLSGRGGMDTISGLSGADKLVGGTHDDTIRGGLGTDTITANGGSDDLFGDEGDDTLDSRDGVNGNDTLIGGLDKDACATDVTEISTESCEIFPDTTPPTVKSVSPVGKRVGPRTNVTATFSEAMTAATINSITFRLRKQGSNTKILATVSYNPVTNKAILNPKNNLQHRTTYKAVVTTEVRDVASNMLDQRHGVPGNQPEVWSFTVR